MKLSPKSRALRSLIATTTRYRPDDTAAIAEARLALRVSKAEDHLAALLSTAPPPTATQRALLARMLRAGATS